MTTASTSVPAASTNRSPSESLPVSMLVATSLMALAFAPLIAAHVANLWARPHYQFFPIVFLGAGILAYVRFPGVASLRAGAAIASWGLLSFAWLVLVAAELLNSGYLAAVAALFFVLAVMWTAGGFTLVRQLLPAWLFLWLIIPPPFGLDNVLVLALQRLTSQWSSSLLDQFHVFHVIAGNVVEVGGQRLLVDEACAGINSLFSVLTCAIFYVLFMRTGPIRAVLLVLSSISWVLLANVVRVFLVAFFASRGYPELAKGWRHDALGYALFAVALILIWSTDRLLMFVTPLRWRTRDAAKTEAPTAPEETDRAAGLAGLRASWMTSWVVSAAFGLLLIGHLAFYTLALSQRSLKSDTANVDKIKKSTLPDKFDGWRLEKFDTVTRDTGSAYGEFSKVWFFVGDSQGATIALDYPFGYWHDLPVCYEGQGWEVDKQADLVTETPGAPGFYSQRTLKKAGVRHGYLLFCQFDETGHVIKPDSGIGATLRTHESLLSRLLEWNQGAGAETHRLVPPVYQFQQFVESDTPLRGPQAEAAQTRFFKAYQAVQKTLFD
jgi:exosortase